MPAAEARAGIIAIFLIIMVMVVSAPMTAVMLGIIDKKYLNNFYARHSKNSYAKKRGRASASQKNGAGEF
jgi:hypothetical protein